MHTSFCLQASKKMFAELKKPKWLIGGAIVVISSFLVHRYFKSAGSPCVVDDAHHVSEAFVFVKPHGQVASIPEFIEAELVKAGLDIIEKGHMLGDTIREKGTIDDHYAAIAAYATKTRPDELPVTGNAKEQFLLKYDVSWESAMKDGLILNMLEAVKAFQMSGPEIGAEADNNKGMKLAPGCYVTFFPTQKKYVVNGFYGRMREEYIQPNAKVTYFRVQWPTKKLSWANFRALVLGATDPSKAGSSSIRAKIYKDYKELGLPFQPSTGNNCVHGSASPLEAMNERRIWLKRTLSVDSFGKLLLRNKFSAAQLTEACANPNTKRGPLFDVVEDLDPMDCMREMTKYL